MFGVEGELDLSQLKSAYRTLVKTWHPDKFTADSDGAHEREAMSRKIIDGYHFLVSIAPETKIKTAEEYAALVAEATIVDYHHKGLLLEITFNEGSTYEYFGVPKNVFLKFHNSDKQMRFGKRNIFHSFVYRKSKSAQEAEAADA